MWSKAIVKEMEEVIKSYLTPLYNPIDMGQITTYMNYQEFEKEVTDIYLFDLGNFIWIKEEVKKFINQGGIKILQELILNKNIKDSNVRRLRNDILCYWGLIKDYVENMGEHFREFNDPQDREPGIFDKNHNGGFYYSKLRLPINHFSMEYLLKNMIDYSLNKIENPTFTKERMEKIRGIVYKGLCKVEYKYDLNNDEYYRKEKAIYISQWCKDRLYNPHLKIGKKWGEKLYNDLLEEE